MQTYSDLPPIGSTAPQAPPRHVFDPAEDFGLGGTPLSLSGQQLQNIIAAMEAGYGQDAAKKSTLGYFSPDYRNPYTHQALRAAIVRELGDVMQAQDFHCFTTTTGDLLSNYFAHSAELQQRAVVQGQITDLAPSGDVGEAFASMEDAIREAGGSAVKPTRELLAEAGRDFATLKDRVWPSEGDDLRSRIIEGHARAHVERYAARHNATDREPQR